VAGVFPVVPRGGLELWHGEDAALFARGRAGVDLLQVVGQDVGVNLRGGEVGMAEHFLDVADVGPALEHLSGAGVAERVGGDSRGDPGLFCISGDGAPQVLPGHGRAEPAEKEKVQNAGDNRAPGSAGVGPEQHGADAFHVFAQVVEGDPADGGNTIFAPLALDDAHGFFLPVDVVDGEPDDFQPAQARGVEQFQKHAVAVSPQGFCVGPGEEPVGLAAGEHIFGPRQQNLCEQGGSGSFASA